VFSFYQANILALVIYVVSSTQCSARARVVLTAGALDLLRNAETIDWTTLYSGEICMDEVQRVRRVARRGIISLPTLLADVATYRQQLRQVAAVNGLAPQSASVELTLPMPSPPRSRQHVTAAKPTVVTAAPHRATKGVNSANPAQLPVLSTDRVEDNSSRSRDKLRLARSASQVVSLQLMTTAAKRLANLRKHCQRSVFAASPSND